MERKPKKIPELSSENAERKYWAVHDSTQFLDWTKAQPAQLPRIKRSTKTISDQRR